MDETSKRHRTTVIPYRARDEQAGTDDNVYLVVMRGVKIGQVFTLGKTSVVIGREDGTEIQLLDSDVSRQHARISWDAAQQRYLLEDLGSSNGTFLDEDPVQGGPRVLDRGNKIQLGHNAVLRFCLGDEVEAEYARNMLNAALRDGLTGAFNRRYFDESLRTQVSFTGRHQAPLALILLDVDHFKRINDTYGHPTGDSILRFIATLIMKNIRLEDILARYGGEEFAIICPQTGEEGAAVLAERIRSRLAQQEYEVGDEVVQVTVSCGVAAYAPGQPPHAEPLVEAADRALYQAKASGRNRTVLFSTLET